MRNRSSACLLLLAAACAVVACSGCGSNASGQAAARIPSDLASRLARESDAVAQTLDRGDACTAARRATALRGQVEGAIADGRIPAALAGPARRRAARLADGITCVPPAAPARHGDRVHEHEREEEGDDD